MATKPKVKKVEVPFVKIDPLQKITLSGKDIEIPEPTYQIDILLEARKSEIYEEEPDAEDQKVFNFCEDGLAADEPIVVDDSDEEMYSPGPSVVQLKPTASENASSKPAARPIDDWKHDPKWVNDAISQLMPPPFESTPAATMAVQRELRTMLKEQDSCKSLKELGWYMPPDLVGDNLFQWIVELHSFDEALPIAKDMKAKCADTLSLSCKRRQSDICPRGVNSLLFEIRFPPGFPIAPPFFRIITPRFLPFIHGGGGHVTGGRSAASF